MLAVEFQRTLLPFSERVNGAQFYCNV